MSPKHLRVRHSEAKDSGARVTKKTPGRMLRNKRGFGTEALMSGAKSGVSLEGGHSD